MISRSSLNLKELEFTKGKIIAHLYLGVIFDTNLVARICPRVIEYIPASTGQKLYHSIMKKGKTSHKHIWSTLTHSPWLCILMYIGQQPITSPAADAAVDDDKASSSSSIVPTMSCADGSSDGGFCLLYQQVWGMYRIKCHINTPMSTITCNYTEVVHTKQIHHYRYIVHLIFPNPYALPGPTWLILTPTSHLPHNQVPRKPSSFWGHRAAGF